MVPPNCGYVLQIWGKQRFRVRHARGSKSCNNEPQKKWRKVPNMEAMSCSPEYGFPKTSVAAMNPHFSKQSFKSHCNLPFDVFGAALAFFCWLALAFIRKHHPQERNYHGIIPCRTWKTKNRHAHIHSLVAYSYLTLSQSRTATSDFHVAEPENRCAQKIDGPGESNTPRQIA